SRGEFVLDLPEGSYTVDVELAGFAPLKDQALEVTQSTPPLRLPLEIPSIQQQIVVTATNTEAPLPQVGSSVTVLTGDQLLRDGCGIEGKGERADYSAAFTRLDTDNNVSNGSFNQTTFTGNFGFVPFRKTELRAIFRAENGRTGVPGAWAFHRPDPDEYFHRRDLAGGILFTHLATVSWTPEMSY